MTKRTDRIYDSLPLPGQPHAPGPKPFAKVAHNCESTLRSLARRLAGSTDLMSSFRAHYERLGD
jgi:hypothetical protein